MAGFGETMLNPIEAISIRPVRDEPPAVEAPAPTPPVTPREAPQAEMRAYKPSFSERVGNLFQDALIGLGADPYKAGHIAHGARDVLQLTPAGVPMGIMDFKHDLDEGDHLGAILAAPAMIPGGKPIGRGLEAGADALRGILADSGLKARNAPKEFGLLTPAAEAEMSNVRISPRLPTGKKITEDVMTPDRLQIDLEAMKRDPKLFDHNVDLVRRYPNLHQDQLVGSSDQVAENFIEHAKANLLHLHDAVDPEIRQRSKLWYEGGNKIANDFARMYSRPGSNRPNTAAASAAAIAALSPQKDWFQNVDLARRVHDIHFTKNNVTFTPEMEETSKRIYGDKALAKLGEDGIAEKYAPILDAIRGKKYSELEDPVEKAAWLRLYDEAHNDRSHRLVTPEGNFGEQVLTQKGVPSGTGWGSLSEIAKAIQALESGGDPKVISSLMGERHKVRSFYNNIIDPQSAHGDVTMDTHAVAAALMRPLSGKSIEVAHNFKNYAGAGLENAKGSAVTGVMGTYPLYAEAYRRAAAERGILPREMQSITWEGVRGLFPETFKTKKNAQAIDNIWREHQKGLISADEARAQIFEKAGATNGIKAPDWHQ
jgi:hypothetical protein